MAEEDNVLFVRRHGDVSPNVDEDVWDDSALIKAYDIAINTAKHEVEKRMGIDKQTGKSTQKKPSSLNQPHPSQCSRQSSNSKKLQKKWSVGAPCRAVYSEDGIDYEAIVSKIYESTNSCVVKFIGYENLEKVDLSSLMESNGLKSQMAQCKEAMGADGKKTNIVTESCDNPAGSHKMNGISEERMDCDSHDSRFLYETYAPNMSSNPVFGSIPPAPPLPPQLLAKLPETDADALSSMLMSWYISGFHTGYYHGLKKGKSQPQKHQKK